jgi:hypothetical protein
MNLYEIDNEILKTFDEETGEILDSERLNELQMDRERKLTNIIHWIKNLRSDVKILKEEEDSFRKRRQSAEKKAEQLTAYIEGYLAGEKFESEDKTAKVSYRQSTSVNVTDVFKLPEFLKKYKDPEPDKVAIGELLKKGETVEGAELVTKMSLIIK